MAKRRPSGDGMVRKREDGRWEGRIVVGHKENGDSIFRYIYADTQKELTAKLRQHIDIYQGVDLTEQSRMTLGGVAGTMAGKYRRHHSAYYTDPISGGSTNSHQSPLRRQTHYPGHREGCPKVI